MFLDLNSINCWGKLMLQLRQLGTRGHYFHVTRNIFPLWLFVLSIYLFVQQ